MEEIILGNINLKLSNENGNVRLKSSDDNVIAINQSVDNISKIVRLNFDIVNNFYKKRVSQESEEKFDLIEINRISLTVVLHYLYLHNSWKNNYKNKADQNLMFNVQDLSNPSTSDMIIFFYKKNHPRDWEERCSMLLGMKQDDLKKYYKERENFYKK